VQTSNPVFPQPPIYPWEHNSFHPEMVVLANLGVNVQVYLCSDRQVASAQTLDFLDIGQKSSFPDWKLGSTGKSFPGGTTLKSGVQVAGKANANPLLLYFS